MFSTCANANKIRYLQTAAGFTHVFIDEAGQCNEPESAVAFSAGGLDARVILAGDPQQLGPTTMGSSLLERIMLTRDPYRGDSFDPRYITKLVRNYRSHPDILQPPSELFYGGELVSCADLELRNELIGWCGLPNPKVPLIFNNCTDGVESFTGTSYRNQQEALTAVDYVHQLVGTANGLSVKPEDIFVITPYHAQVDCIQEILNSCPSLCGVQVRAQLLYLLIFS